MTRLPKHALRDPVAWVSEAGADIEDAEVVRKARREAEAFVPLSNDLARLASEQGRAGRAVGDARSHGGDVAEAIAAAKALGDQSRALERHIRDGLEDIRVTLETARTDASASRRQARDEVSAPRYFDALPNAASPGASSVSTHTAFDADDYSRYVRRHPARTAYHELGLRDLIADVNGQESHYVLARAPDGAVRGVLPLVHVKSPLFGSYLVSMPWFNYGGPLADDELAADTMMRAAGDMARELGCSHAEIRETVPREGWSARTDKVSMTLALPETVAALDKRFGTSLRAQSNKAVRAGCTFRVGGRELLDDFYQVFCTNMRDLGTPVQSRAFFDALLELFGEDAFVTVVSRDGKPLAAALLIAHGSETLEVPWASSLRKANSLGVNMLLYRRTIGEAVTRGYRHFDFGRSTAGGSTWRFKKQWGAVPRQLHWHYWTADGSDMAGPSADTPKFRLAVAVWQRLPVSLTRRLGPSLVRGLP